MLKFAVQNTDVIFIHETLMSKIPTIRGQDF